MKLGVIAGAPTGLHMAGVSGLLRTLLLHIGNGYSLREMASRAKAAGLPSVSDVAILDRLEILV